jgi:hypothetical protein
MSGWKAYFPKRGESAADAFIVPIPTHTHIQSAEDAALAAGDERISDVWREVESGYDVDRLVVIISPNNVETRWMVTSKLAYVHHATPLKDDNDEGRGHTAQRPAQAGLGEGDAQEGADDADRGNPGPDPVGEHAAPAAAPPHPAKELEQ